MGCREEIHKEQMVNNKNEEVVTVQAEINRIHTVIVTTKALFKKLYVLSIDLNCTLHTQLLYGTVF